MKDIVLICVGALAGIFLFGFFKGCKPPVTDYETITHIDTLYKTSIDTVYKEVVNTIYEDNYIPVYIDSVDSSVINTYHDTISEENITGLYTMRVDGELLNTKFNYTIDYPEITRVDSIFINRTDSILVELNKSKMRLYLGGGVGVSGNGIRSATGTVDFRFKNEYMIGYGYMLGFDNLGSQHLINFKIPLKFRKD